MTNRMINRKLSRKIDRKRYAYYQRGPNRIAILSIFLALGFGVVLAAAQTRPPARTGTIAGHVVLEDGQPVDGATVQCMAVGGAAGSRMATTDAEGNFSFTGLAPIAYRIASFAPGMVSAETIGGEPPVARIGESVTLTLIKGGVITGRVTNSAGEPVVAIQVSAIQVRDADGRPAKGPRMTRMRQTDDRGIYRIFGLPAGHYLVVANPMSGGIGNATPYDQETPTFYPSSNRDGATEVAVQAGAEVSGIDIRYREARGHSISGTLEGGTEGAAINFGMQVSLYAAGSSTLIGSGSALPVGNVRRFVINGVPDGEYDLMAQGFMGQDESMMSSPRRVTVRGADVTGLKLQLIPLSTIAGKVTIEKGAQIEGCVRGRESLLPEIYLRAQRDDKAAEDERLDIPGGRAGGAVSDAGDFTLRNVAPGQIRLQADLPGDDWYVKSLSMPGAGAARRVIDLARSPLAIKAGEKIAGVTMTIAEGAASVSGRIEPEKMKRGRWRLHLVPAEAAQADNTLLYYETEVAANGSYALRHIAPGKYWIVARPVADGEPTEVALKPAAWDAAERAKLRKEAEAAKLEIELKPCQRVKDHALALP